MGKVYEHVTVFHCLNVIYQQGLSFAKAGKRLIELEDASLFVPGMINICLATEILLKSINATQRFLEEEEDVNGKTVYIGRDGTMDISPGGQGHALSKLYENLPDDAKDEISNLVKREGWEGSVFDGLCKYDNVFVDWRYIYEKNDPRTLGTSPLFEIFNAVDSYCKKFSGRAKESIATEIDEATWQKSSSRKKRK